MGATGTIYSMEPEQRVRLRDLQRKYYSQNRGRWNAIAARWYANFRAPGSVPADFDFEATVPFYEEAWRLTQQTGNWYEVDHILSLTLGGKHVASNLQVLTRYENRAKARSESRRSQ